MTSPHTLAIQVTPGALLATGLGVAYGDVVALHNIKLTLIGAARARL